MKATSQVWLFKVIFKVIKIRKFSSPVTPATFEELNSHAWVVATILDSAEQSHHYRKFCWTVLL